MHAERNPECTESILLPQSKHPLHEPREKGNRPRKIPSAILMDFARRDDIDNRNGNIATHGGKDVPPVNLSGDHK